MRNLFWLVFLTLTISSCGEFRKQFGRQPGHTLITINTVHDGGHNPLSAIWPLNGGMLVIMKSFDTNNFVTSFFAPSDSTSIQLAVPNGVYRAGAIGWEGASTMPCTPGASCSRAVGQSKCGIAFSDTSFSLTGQAVTIPITLGATICQQGYSTNSTPFSDAAYNPSGDSAFPTINLQFASPYNAGSYNVAVYLNTYVALQGVRTRTGQFKLGCVALTSGIASTQMRLPVGKANDFPIFSYTLTIHSSVDTTCTGSIVDKIEFDKGFINRPTSGPFVNSSITYATNVDTVSIN